MQLQCVCLVDITKNYGPIRACDGINLKLEPGKIHAILGNNGAGKSTLMNILAGLVQPDAGEININGVSFKALSPTEAKQHGIAMVHQGFSLVEELTVWENLKLALGPSGLATPGLGTSGRKAIFAYLPAVSDTSKYRTDGSLTSFFNLDNDAKVRDLDMGQRQELEILKALNSNPSILILDEPTAFLDEAQTQHLKEVLEELKTIGCQIALISHDLDHVLDIADQITVLENGKVLEEDQKPYHKGFTYGTPTAPKRSRLASSVSEAEEPVLELQNLRVKSESHVTGFKELNLKVLPSQIVALVDQGMDPTLDGRRALLNLFLGQATPWEGKVFICNKTCELQIPGALKNAGIAILPEDRKQSGCIPEMSVTENLFLLNPLTQGRDPLKNLFLNKREMRKKALQLIEEYNVSPPNPDIALGLLSGGNQQRVLLARELSSNPVLLVVASLTEGLDVTATSDIRWNIQRAANRGVAVLLIGNDPNLIELAHSQYEMSDISKLDTGVLGKAIK